MSQPKPKIRRMTAWNGRLLISSLLFILLCTLFPFQFVWDVPESVPDFFHEFAFRFTKGDVALNILLFLPVGFSLNCLLSTTQQTQGLKLLTALAVCAGFSALVEICQIFIPVRSPNFVDIMSNSLGGMVGYFFGHLFRKNLAQKAGRLLNRNYRLTMKQLVALFLGYLTLVLCVVLSLPSPSSLSNWEGSFPLVLGNEKTGDRPWLGTIQEVYLSDRTLTESEINQIFSNRFNFKNSFLAAYPLTELGQKQYSDQTGNLPAFAWQGTPVARTEEGLVLQADRWLETIAPAPLLAERVRHSSQFTLVTAIATAQLNQQGPARIVSQSDSPFYRNFTLGQEGADLEVRLRTLASDVNGTRPSFTAPNFFTDTRLHRVVVTYGKGGLQIYKDGLAQVYRFDASTDFISAGPEPFVIYHTLIFVPLGYLLALMIQYQKLVRWVGLMVLSAGLPALVIEGLLAIEDGRSFSGRHLILGVLFTGITMLIVRFGLPMEKQVDRLNCQE